MSVECLTEDVSLGNLFLNRMDVHGVRWLLTDIEGWWTLPENEVIDVARGWDDGSYDTGSRYLSRTFTVTGVILPQNSSQIPAARAELVAALDLCRKSAWFITRESYRTVGSIVRLSGQPLISTNVGSGKTDFSFGLRAPDPVKYSLNGGAPPGWWETTIPGNGTQNIDNEGNYQVFPRLTINGPTTGPVEVENVTEATKLVVQSLVPSGSQLVIDVKNRSVSLNGVRNKRQHLRWDTDWPSLHPGSSTYKFGAYDEDVPNAAVGATLDVQWRHGWIA
jgi:hypothetical protein